MFFLEIYSEMYLNHFKVTIQFCTPSIDFGDLKILATLTTSSATFVLSQLATNCTLNPFLRNAFDLSRTIFSIAPYPEVGIFIHRGAKITTRFSTPIDSTKLFNLNATVISMRISKNPHRKPFSCLHDHSP